jgi:hypothetical protein
MNVIPAQAGIRAFLNWTPACAGVTDRYYETELNNILDNISGTTHQTKG